MIERVSFFDARDYSNANWVMLQHAFDQNKPASASIKASIRHIYAGARKDEFKMLVNDIKKQEREVKRAGAEDALSPLTGKTPFVYYMPNPNFNFKKDDIVVVYGGHAAVHTYNRTKQVSFSNNVCKVNSIDANGNLNVTTIFGGSEITTQPNHCALLVQYNERKILIYFHEFHEDRSSMSSSSKPTRKRSSSSSSSSNPVKRRRSSRSSSRSSSGGKKRKRANHTQRRRR
jgi:hypothetical protein